MTDNKILYEKNVLIVDDESDVLDTVEMLLPMCHVLKATSFEQGKKLMKEERIDIAILDIMGVNGYELLKMAKREGIIAVMLTAHALSPGNIKRSYNEGAASYIPKDEMGEIVTVLVDVLEAYKKGKNTWSRWLDRFSYFCQTHFGVNWQDKDKEFWERFIGYDT